MSDNQQTNSSNLSNLIEKTETKLKKFKNGAYVEGVVVSIDNRYMLLDIGAKSEGVIAIDELKSLPVENRDIKIGDKLFATVVQAENRQGNLVLSIKKSELEYTWNTLKKLYDDNEVIEVAVIDYLKGGLLVDVKGQRGFIPISHLDRNHFEQFNNAMAHGSDEREVKTLGGLKGELIKCRIIELSQEKNRLILSEKEVKTDEEIENRQKRLDDIQIGDVIECTVSTILPYGVLVDLGGFDGLIHISEIAWEKVNNPSDYFKNGEKVKAKIISIEGDKIALSYKELKDNPWNKVEEKYPLGKRVTATVSKIVPFGAFMELEPGLDGLIHISETIGPLNIGDTVEAVVVKVDQKDRKLALSIRQLEDSKIYR